MALIWLAEITAGTSGSPTQTTLRVASAPYGYNHPSAPGLYLPVIKQAANIRRHIVADGRTFGSSSPSYGELVLDNVSGDYDDYLDYGYGFEGKLLLGDHLADYSTFVTVIAGKIEQAVGDLTEIIFRFRDRQIELDREVSPVVYAGTNSGTTGLEGLPGDIKGQNKIRFFGICQQVTPDPLNTSDQVFGVNHTKAGAQTALSAFNAVRVNGSAWTFNANYANAAALQGASPPSQGFYDTAVSVALIRMGGTIGGQVTVDITESGTAATNRLPSIMNRLLLDAGVSSGDIVAADITQLGIDAPWDAGIVIKGETYRQALDMLAASFGGWYAPNRLGQYNIKQIKSPDEASSPSPVVSATFRRFIYPETAISGDYRIEQLERIVSNDEGRGVPAWKITVNYLRMWTVLDADSIAAAVSEANRAKFSREYRSVTAEDAGVKDQYPEAVELFFDTVLINESDAQDLADHLLTLYGVKRNLYRLTASYDADLAAAIDLGDVVKIYYPRFGLDAGKLFNIHGILYDARAKTVELECWG